MSGIRCQICVHGGNARGGLNCHSCARAALYNLRIHQVSLLLDKQDLADRVNQVVSPNHGFGEHSKSLASPEALAERARCIESSQHHTRSAELDEAKRRIETISEHALQLRSDIVNHRLKIEADRAKLEQRRSRLDTARAQTDRLREDAEAAKTRSAATSVHTLHRSLVSWRARHLQTLAFWARLERERRPWTGRGDNSRSFEYRIAGLVIPDLRNLNHLQDGDERLLTAVLTHICRLLYLVSRYLQIRLPAEIVVPHRDWPLPMILSPLSSYTGQRLVFPHKSLSGSHSFSSGRDNDDQYRTMPRPRPLFLLRPLRQMASEDPTGYARFVEAAAILAWDVAWLCRVQGLPVAETDWGDACDIGRNLWRLLIECTERRQVPGEEAMRNSEQARDDAKLKSETTAVGVYSHGTAFNYLRAGSNLGAQTSIMDVSVRGWALGNPVKIISELRASLLGELAIMEAVLVGEDGEELGTAENGMQHWDSGDIERGKDSEPATEAVKVKGRSGWMKLRTRQADAEAP